MMKTSHLNISITSISTHLAMDSDVEDSDISFVLSVGLCKTTSIGVQYFVCLYLICTPDSSPFIQLLQHPIASVPSAFLRLELKYFSSELLAAISN